MRRFLITTAAFLLVLATLDSGAWGQFTDQIALLPPDICPYPEELQTGNTGGMTNSGMTPEPTTVGLAAIGAFMFACKRRRRA
jgi:hypothetical protein